MAITDNIKNLTNGGSYGDILSSVGNIGAGVGGIIKKIKSLSKDQKDPSSIKDLYTDGFLVQDSQFAPDFFARAFDEPTYLTFKVEFNFGDVESEYRNMAYNNNGLLENITDSRLDTMYDYLPEPFLEPYRRESKNRFMESSYRTTSYTEDGEIYTGEAGGEAFIENDIVDASLGKTYSTETYLDINLGDHGRAALLHNFKLALKDIQNNFPYYLQSINGINSLFKVDHASGIRLKDAKIELECMEGLDLKITQLLNMYKKIVWDDVYQRWILPDMMRYFNMKIYISEIRLFHDFVKGKPEKQQLHNFSEKDKRNSLYSNKDKWYDTAANALRTATALSNTFLGTKSNLNTAINYAASTYETARGLYDSIAGAIVDINMCNNAFNYVMPTICIDCHMCEFDITNINRHLDSLKAYKVTESPKPKIIINVGQAKDIQIYPLNASLKYIEKKGYFNTIKDYISDKSTYDEIKGSSISPNDINNARNNSLKYTGNYISDDALKATIKSNNLQQRIKDYDFNLQYYTGQTEAESILAKRLNRLMINDRSSTNYPRGYTPKELARMSLTTAGIQEVQSVLGWVDNPDDNFDMEWIIGTHSTSTSPDKSTRESIKAIGETLKGKVDVTYVGENNNSIATHDKSSKEKLSSYATLQDTSIYYDKINDASIYFGKTITEDSSIIYGGINENKDSYSATSPNENIKNAILAVGKTLNEALDKIYNGEEIQSMVVSEEMRSKIASDMFNEYIEKLKDSTATSDGPLKEILKAYDIIKESSIQYDTIQEPLLHDYPVVKSNSPHISTATGTKFNQYN